LFRVRTSREQQALRYARYRGCFYAVTNQQCFQQRKRFRDASAAQPREEREAVRAAAEPRYVCRLYMPNACRAAQNAMRRRKPP